MSQEEVAQRPDGLINQIHYRDAANAAVAAVLRGKAGEVYLAADDKPLTREQICAEAINAPRFEGKAPPAFTGPTGGGVDYGGKGTGKVLDCSATRKALDWQPIYPTFGAFIKTLTSE